MARLTEAEKIALLSIAGKLRRVINNSDAVGLALKGYAENLGAGGYRTTAAGRNLVDVWEAARK